VELLEGLGFDFGRLQRDLRVTDRTAERHAVEKLVTAGVGLAVPLAVVVASAAGGGRLPPGPRVRPPLRLGAAGLPPPGPPPPARWSSPRSASAPPASSSRTCCCGTPPGLGATHSGTPCRPISISSTSSSPARPAPRRPSWRRPTPVTGGRSPSSERRSTAP